jgi:hypothetical protein
MPFEVERFDRFVVVRWLTLPEVEDVSRISALIQLSYRQAGQPVFYVTRVPQHLDGNPSPAARDAMVSNMREWLRGPCHSIHVVVARSGVLGSLQRTVVRGMVVLIGFHGKVSIHESFAGCARQLQALGVEPSTLARTAGACGPD